MSRCTTGHNAPLAKIETLSLLKRTRELKYGKAHLVSTNLERLRLVELVRTYYIFLSDHFAESVSDAWSHIYQLLELPQNEWNYYAYLSTHIGTRLRSLTRFNTQ